MSDLYELLEIDPNDVAEKRCGMLHCTGPAMADDDKWLKLEATGTKQGETVFQATTTVPVCPPHLLTWEVFFDTTPEDVLPYLYAALIDLERYPMERVVDSLRAPADAESDEE